MLRLRLIKKWWRSSQNELEKMDRKTKTVMTMNKELHLRSDIARILGGRETVKVMRQRIQGSILEE